jgi:outer membrane lipoprotein-sorting protein
MNMFGLVTKIAARRVVVLAGFTTASVCMPSVAHASQSAAAAREITAFASAWAGITAYSATVAMVDQKGTQSQSVVFNYMFRKPSNITVHVVAGRNVGVTLTWDGGPTVIAWRGSGFVALFKRTLSLHDPLVTTLRGSTIDDVSFGAILAQGQHDAGSLSEAAGETIGGVHTDAVTLIRTGSSADAGLTREVVELSAVTHLPMRVMSYEGSALVQDVEFSNVKVER